MKNGKFNRAKPGLKESDREDIGTMCEGAEFLSK